MDRVEALFSLSARRGVGVSCNEQGLFVGDVTLLERSPERGAWRPRTNEDLSRELSKTYGLPIEIDPDNPGLAVIKRARLIAAKWPEPKSLRFTSGFQSRLKLLRLCGRPVIWPNGRMN